MCSYKTWFQDDKSGYVIECPNCNKIKIGFGNILVTLDAKGFDKFRCYVDAYNQDTGAQTDPHIKNIVLATPCNSVHLLLSRQELAGLHQMVEYADNEMKTAEMIKLFEC